MKTKKINGMISIMISICMIASFVFCVGVVSAEEVVEVDISKGSVIITDNQLKAVNSENTAVNMTLEDNAVVCVSGVTNGENANFIYVQNQNQGLIIQLNNVTIDHTARTAAGIPIAVMDSTCTLELIGSNTLKGYTKCAAIYYNTKSNLTITARDEAQQLIAEGGVDAAAIGHNSYGASSSVYITDKITINANDYNYAGTITIEQGTIRATASKSDDIWAGGGAGIGGGYSRKATKITINGGIIYATGAGFGAGIGGSDMKNVSQGIEINGGIIYATAGKGSPSAGGPAAIGGGASNDKQTVNSTDVTIKGGVIFATSEQGAGIGANTTFGAETPNQPGESKVIIEHAFVLAKGYQGMDVLAASVTDDAGTPVYRTKISFPDAEETSATITIGENEPMVVPLTDKFETATYIPAGAVSIRAKGEKVFYGEQNVVIAENHENSVTFQQALAVKNITVVPIETGYNVSFTYTVNCAENIDVYIIGATYDKQALSKVVFQPVTLISGERETKISQDITLTINGADGGGKM